MKQISGKDFCRVLGKKGWKLERIKGSHHIYGKRKANIKISVPIHGNKPLKRGLLKYFLKIAGISEDEL